MNQLNAEWNREITARCHLRRKGQMYHLPIPHHICYSQ